MYRSTAIFRGNAQRICSLIGTRRKYSYIILLPEEPIDTAENNALLRDDGGAHLPDFPLVTAEKCFSGVGKLALDIESSVWELEEKIRVGEASGFGAVVVPLDAVDARLNMAWAAAKTLYITRQDILPQKTYLSIHERARKSRLCKFQSLPIYHACKSIAQLGTGVSAEGVAGGDTRGVEQRVVRKFLQEARLNGIELENVQAAQFITIIKSLDRRKSEFRKKVSIAAGRFHNRISDAAVMEGFPPELRQRMTLPGCEAATGPWEVTLQPTVFPGFMEHCSERSLRWNAQHAWALRGTHRPDPQLNNTVNIKEIRSLRMQQAKLLGFDCFASMSMETKMADSVENVLSLITSLRVAAAPQQKEDMAGLRVFADAQGFAGDALQDYDVPYYTRLQRDHLYSISKNVHEYLPFEHVLTTLLQLCSRLFGISFEEVEQGERRSWHPSVRCFNIVDESGSHRATFFLDPYQRPGEKMNPMGRSGWMVSLRNASTVCATPAAALIFNFPQTTPTEDDVLLSLEDVVTLFGKFGEALQQLLTTVRYGEASGLTNIEWDAVPMCSHFLANWVFVPQVLASLTRHYSTGEVLGPQQVKEVIRASNHMAAHKLLRHLYLAHLDLSMHMHEEFWGDVVSELWPRYLPYQLDRNDFHPCAFTDSLSDVWAAAYYSHTWARVMAADCTQAFMEEGEEQWPVVGKRFRETFLSLGGGCHPAEVFRRFRGRDPSPSALTDLYGFTAGRSQAD